MLYFLEAATTGAVDGAAPSGGLLGMLLPLVLKSWKWRYNRRIRK